MRSIVLDRLHIVEHTTRALNIWLKKISYVRFLYCLFPSCQASARVEGCTVACAKNKKSLNFASSGSWHLKVGMETPENDFQIYRPINDPWRAVCSLEREYRWGNIQKSLSGNNFWLECPKDLRSTPLSYILNALLRYPPLDCNWELVSFVFWSKQNSLTAERRKGQPMQPSLPQMDFLQWMTCKNDM